MARFSTPQVHSEWAEYERTTKDWSTIGFLGRGPVYLTWLVDISLEGRVEGDSHDR
jgi:hypothetical protein